jgi:hypothetical protein
MSATKPDDDAFPRPDCGFEGLTKREYFACHIMAGIADLPRIGTTDAEVYARNAVALADALVAALNKGPCVCGD